MCQDGVGVGLGVTPTKSHRRSGEERQELLGTALALKSGGLWNVFPLVLAQRSVGFQAPPSPGARKLLDKRNSPSSIYKVLSPFYYFVSALQLLNYPNFTQEATVTWKSEGICTRLHCWPLPESGLNTGLLYSRTQSLFLHCMLASCGRREDCRWYTDESLPSELSQILIFYYKKIELGY